MKIRLIAVGTKMPSWVTEGYKEFARRMPSEMTLELCEIQPGQRGKGRDVARAMQKEGDAMLAAIASSDYVVALEVKGKAWTTEQLSTQMEGWRMNGCDVALLVGGPEGLDRRCVERADIKWSLSPLTLPHPMVRLLVSEQLYRGWSIMTNHPYHRA
ncbi:23S rRNA (pseudouridine(1915)-N(3))-methyltransferase RlmH [Litoribacillus peritrichatus]|uniref:Ribosomal RNA large subunit methyltransferase H n=1 Tax=Litoribacillus peritrichatus TaxID=718191 RepID=A0ABP7MGJ9_9GAMM